eukprot:gene26316-biopygen15783
MSRGVCSRPESSWNRSCQCRMQPPAHPFFFPYFPSMSIPQDRHHDRKTNEKGHLKVWKGGVRLYPT